MLMYLYVYYSCVFHVCFFFKQKAAYEMRISDWSSDVCSSDLLCLHFIEKLVDPRSIRLHRLIHGEGGRFPEIGLIFYERAPKNVEAILAAYLDHCIQEGSIRKVDTMIAAGNLIAVVMSGTQDRNSTRLNSSH